MGQPNGSQPAESDQAATDTQLQSLARILATAIRRRHQRPYPSELDFQKPLSVSREGLEFVSESRLSVTDG